MTEQSSNAAPELLQLWRDWLTESERQFNSFFADSMGSDPAARTIGGVVELYAGFQRILAESMQRYLALINMPSRTDVVGLGETLRSIEDRLARIEETLQTAADAIDARERDFGRVGREPLRTRQPAAPVAAGVVPETNGGAPVQPAAGPPPIPEELRR
jgi:hypothetical protein